MLQSPSFNRACYLPDLDPLHPPVRTLQINTLKTLGKLVFLGKLTAQPKRELLTHACTSRVRLIPKVAAKKTAKPRAA